MTTLQVPTRSGRRGSADLMGELFGLIQPQGRSGWVLATDLPWLEQLRERHEAAVIERVRTMASLPGALHAVDAIDERWADENRAWDSARRRALAAGSVIPPQPQRLSDAECRRRLDVTWEPIAAAHRALAEVVEEVGQAVAMHADELDRAYLQHARHQLWSGPGMIGLAGWFQTLIDDVDKGVHAHAVGEIAGWVGRWRHEVDPVGAPVSAGVIW